VSCLKTFFDTRDPTPCPLTKYLPWQVFIQNFRVVTRVKWIPPGPEANFRADHVAGEDVGMTQDAED